MSEGYEQGIEEVVEESPEDQEIHQKVGQNDEKPEVFDPGKFTRPFGDWLSKEKEES